MPLELFLIHRYMRMPLGEPAAGGFSGNMLAALDLAIGSMHAPMELSRQVRSMCRRCLLQAYDKTALAYQGTKAPLNVGAHLPCIPRLKATVAALVPPARLGPPAAPVGACA